MKISIAYTQCDVSTARLSINSLSIPIKICFTCLAEYLTILPNVIFQSFILPDVVAPKRSRYSLKSKKKKKKKWKTDEDEIVNKTLTI